MNVIDNLKKLLEVVKTEHPLPHRVGTCDNCCAHDRLIRLGFAPVFVNLRPTFPAALALVEIQEALRALVPWLDGIKAKDAARAAVRLDGLAKEMEEK